MKFMHLAMPGALILLLILFFTGLPDLKHCALPGGTEAGTGSDDKKDKRREAVFLLLLCAVYGFAAFFRLGNTYGPRSFEAMESRSAVFELESGDTPSRIMLFTGVGTGTYEIQYSRDGESYGPAAAFEQIYSSVLKWQALSPDTELRPAYVKISCTSGSPYLGEVCFLNGDGELIPVSSDMPRLCDEQDTCAMVQDYMNSAYFDEIYHARTAWEHLNGIWPYEISHPPLGKIIISAGISLFGMTPFGWRFTGTLSGILMLPVMYALLKRIFGDRTVPALGTVVFASDFMHLTQTRIATIDSYAVLFILLMYLFMYGFYSEGSCRDLALSGLFFGIGAASKWTCIYAGGGLAVLWLMYWINEFSSCRAAGKKDVSALSLPWKAFIKNCLFCLLFFVALPLVIYYFSYIPYGIARGVSPFSGEYMRTVLKNQEFMFTYHVNVKAEHPYSSRWYQWILDIRPILYSLGNPGSGKRSVIAAFLNPALCWGGLVSLIVTGYAAVCRRDRKAAFILVGYLAQLVPWMFIKRLTFEYHYFPSSVFLVLALGYVFELIYRNRRNWRSYLIPFAGVSVLLFLMFYPYLSGIPVSADYCDSFLHWFSSWPL